MVATSWERQESEIGERISQGSPEKQNQSYTYRKRFIIRNWLMILWKLGSPVICHLPSASWRPRKVSGVVPAQRPENKGSQWGKSQSKGRRRPMSQLHGRAGSKGDKFFLPPLFYFIHALNRLDNSHPHRRGQSTKCTNSNAISSRNTFTDILGYNV